MDNTNEDERYMRMALREAEKAFDEKEIPIGCVPYAVMAMLVVYCLKGISFVKMPFGLPEMISVVLVVVLHVWKRNTLLSIVGGTICYMVLAIH